MNDKLTTWRILSVPDHPQTSDIEAHWLASAACVMGTPFGCPVEPEVNNMNACRSRSNASEEMVGRGE